MSGYMYFVWYNTKVSKDVLYILVSASTPIEACEKALELLREAGQEGGVEITGCQRLV